MNLVRASKLNRSAPQPSLPLPMACARCDDIDNDGNNTNFAYVAISGTMSTWHRCRFIFVSWPIEIWLSREFLLGNGRVRIVEHQPIRVYAIILFTKISGSLSITRLRTVVRLTHRIERCVYYSVRGRMRDEPQCVGTNEKFTVN